MWQSNIVQLPLALTPNGDQIHNLGMCQDWELNWWPVLHWGMIPNLLSHTGHVQLWDFFKYKGKNMHLCMFIQFVESPYGLKVSKLNQLNLFYSLSSLHKSVWFGKLFIWPLLIYKKFTLHISHCHLEQMFYGKKKKRKECWFKKKKGNL